MRFTVDVCAFNVRLKAEKRRRKAEENVFFIGSPDKAISLEPATEAINSVADLLSMQTEQIFENSTNSSLISLSELYLPYSFFPEFFKDNSSAFIFPEEVFTNRSGAEGATGDATADERGTPALCDGCKIFGLDGSPVVIFFSFSGKS